MHHQRGLSIQFGTSTEIKFLCTKNVNFRKAVISWNVRIKKNQADFFKDLEPDGNTQYHYHSLKY